MLGIFHIAMRQERNINGHRIVVFQEGDVINNRFVLELYGPGASTPELTLPVAVEPYSFWRRLGTTPQDFLFEQAASHIAFKSEIEKKRELAEKFKQYYDAT